MLAVPMLCSCDRSELENWARHVRNSFASKLGHQRGMRSVPPRGSGWVQPVAFENLANSHADHQPTRYCVVVLTSCRVDDRLLRQSLLALALTLVLFHDAPVSVRASETASIEYCSLISSPEAYDAKEVRVHGNYMVVKTGTSTFVDTSCPISKSVWVEFNPDLRSCSSSKSVSSLEQMRRKSGATMRRHSSGVILPSKVAEVEFVGTFSSSNRFKPTENSTNTGLFDSILSPRERADFVFTVKCIGKLKATRL